MENSHSPDEPVGGFAPRRRTSRGGKVQNNVQQDQTPLEDILKIQSSQPEITSSAMKTPVSVLQELLSRRMITPSYELVQIEGAIHEPTFRYRVSFTDKEVPFSAMGAGRSKKEAKHAAARALIDKLTGSTLPDQQNMLHNNVPNGDGQITSGNIESNNNYEEKVVGNPIGWLQEMCMARRWPPPTYETEMEVGLPHERQFTIACTILKYREVGKGKSKKIAKRLAAHKMWTRLEETPLDSQQITQTLDEDYSEENRSTILKRYGDLKDAHIPTLTHQNSRKVAQFHKSLKAATGECIDHLQNICLANKEINFIQFLQQIAAEHQFEVTFVDIEEKSCSGRCQCLVQLSTLPVAVCHGSGSTYEEAQTHAAQNALEYLKIMTKK